MRVTVTYPGGVLVIKPLRKVWCQPRWERDEMEPCSRHEAEMWGVYDRVELQRGLEVGYEENWRADFKDEEDAHKFVAALIRKAGES